MATKRWFKVEYWRQDYGWRGRKTLAIGPHEAMAELVRDYFPTCAIPALRPTDSVESPSATMLRQWEAVALPPDNIGRAIQLSVREAE